MLIYIAVSILFVVLDFFIAIRSFAKKNAVGRCTGITCFMAGIVNLSYAFGVFAKTELLYSILNSIYFCSIDIMLAYFYAAAGYQTGLNSERRFKSIESFMLIWMCIDIAALITNPVHGYAMSYVLRDGATTYPFYKYSLRFIYNFHLALTYSFVVLILIMLYMKAASIAGNYRRQYYYIITGIVIVVIINCIYLFIPGNSLATAIDWSLFGYTVAAFTIYWSFFEYTEHGMLREFKNYMFDHIDTGMVMFDYNGNNLLVNRCAKELLPGEAFAPEIKEEEFTRICGIAISRSSYSVQVFINQKTVRCDMEVMFDRKHRGIGRIYSFKDTQSDTDLLTGYWAWESFKRFERTAAAEKLYPAVCALFDINALQRYNNNNGRSAGDMLLKAFSEKIMECMPENAYFVRGREAELIVVCPGMSEDEVRSDADRIRVTFRAPTEYSLISVDGKKLRFNDAVTISERGLRVKKLLSKNAGHSDNLTALIQALQECDPDTEEHVRRTRHMGDMLGRKLKLTDIELSDLSLLCLLHDIGKIAVPLDILNKPGKLSVSEWNVLKTHVHKGYQIGLSNSVTKSIADMILHHHERWDGTGYPDGLAGEEIPLLSRIISVVDAFDAMTNDRVYRKAMSADEAFEELRKCSGSQFDPELVSEFIALSTEQGFGSVSDSNAQKAGMQNDEVNDDLPDKEVNGVRYARYRFDENDRITDVYEGFEELTGYTADFIKHNIFRQNDLVPAEDLDEYKNHIQRELKDNGMLYLEHRLLRRDGKIVRVLCYGRWYYDSSIRARRCEAVVTETMHPVK